MFRRITSLTLTTRNRVLITVVAVALLLLLCVLSMTRTRSDSLSLQFVGYTNLPRMAHPTALFAISNRSGAPLQIRHLVEVKTAGWPFYGPQLQQSWNNCPLLPPHQSTILDIHVPEYGSAWRVRWVYGEPPSKWDMTRITWAVSLQRRKWHLPARLICRGLPRQREVTTPEMNL